LANWRIFSCASFAGGEDIYANNNIQNIPASLRNCATPDPDNQNFHTASTPQEIDDALQAMFNHALQTAHLTN